MESSRSPDEPAYSRMVDGMPNKEPVAAADDEAAVPSPHRPDSHARSLAKGLTWRATATATTTLIAFAITGQIDAALQIGLFEFLAKVIARNGTCWSVRSNSQDRPPSAE